MSQSPIIWSKRKVWTAEAILEERAALTEAEYGQWGRLIEIETWRRIRVSVAAYAYEFEADIIMTDERFDQLAQTINPLLGTCHPLLDEFFAFHFTPMSGMWVHQHPDIPGLKRTYERRRTMLAAK